MTTKAWRQAKIKLATVPFKKREVVWITRNDLLADFFLVPNLVLMNKEGKLGFLRMEVLPTYVESLSAKKGSDKLTTMWERAAKTWRKARRIESQERKQKVTLAQKKSSTSIPKSPRRPKARK